MSQFLFKMNFLMLNSIREYTYNMAFVTSRQRVYSLYI